MDNLAVIGHRGVRKINVENTKGALKEAEKYGVDAIEFDVRLTKDKVPVLCHNRSLKQVYGVNKWVDELTYAEVKGLATANGETLPTLEEILQLGIKVPLLFDLKNSGSGDIIFKMMQRPKYKNVKWAITTFLPAEGERIKRLDPDRWVSLGTILHPLHTIEAAQRIGANCITINIFLLNYLDYFKARRAGLKIALYVNYLPFLLTTPWIVKLLKLLYPGIIIVTDRPDKIVPIIKR